MRTVTLALLATLAACGGGKDDTGAFDPTTFEGGQFQFTSYDVEDGCLDGSMDVLFLPEGAGTTNDWQYPVELPSWSDLPATYTIQLQDPFSDMEVTVEAGATEGTMVVTGAEQTDVEWDADNYPGCLVDMSIDVELTIDGPDDVSGAATLRTSGFQADPDHCPAADADPCDVVLFFTGKRI